MTEGEENQLRAALVAAAAALGQAVSVMEYIHYTYGSNTASINALKAATRAIKMLEGAQD